MAAHEDARIAPCLPTEIIWRIAFYLTICSSSDHSDSPRPADAFSKPLWSDIDGFSMASKALRIMVLRNWFRVVHIREDDDWEMLAEKFPFALTYTSTVHCTSYDICTYIAINHSEQFTNITTFRLTLPVPSRSLADLLEENEFLDAIPTSITVFEIENDMYPSPCLMKGIAEKLPNLKVLRIRQPAVWCNLCFTCIVPQFKRRASLRTIVYNDGRGLPGLYASHLANLEKLHTVSITVGVEKDARPFPCVDDEKDETYYPWSGECGQCLRMLDNDPAFRQACLARKKTSNTSHLSQSVVQNGVTSVDEGRRDATKGDPVNVPPNLRRVEWHFEPIEVFEREWDTWKRIIRELYD